MLFVEFFFESRVKLVNIKKKKWKFCSNKDNTFARIIPRRRVLNLKEKSKMLKCIKFENIYLSALQAFKKQLFCENYSMMKNEILSAQLNFLHAHVWLKKWFSVSLKLRVAYNLSLIADNKFIQKKKQSKYFNFIDDRQNFNFCI